MIDGNVVPFSEIESSEFNLNLAVKQGQQISKTLKELGIREATFDSGT